MNPIQVSDIDLRLLRVLAAVLETNEVARAADLLGVTPSAVSHSLRLLRKRLGDPLLVRSGGGLKATPLATSLQPALRAGMSQLAEVLAKELTFEPKQSSRAFSLAIPDHPLFTMLPDVIGRLRQLAPNINVRLYVIGPDIGERLASGALDLVLAGGEVETTLALDRDVMRSRVIDEKFQCVLRRDHPAAMSKHLGMDAYLATPHVHVSMTGDDHGMVDEILAQTGLSRRVAVTVPSFLTAAWISAASDLIATLPETIARRALDRANVVVRDPPIVLPSSTAYLWWHPRFQQEPGHVWWRQLLLDAFSSYRRQSHLPQARCTRSS